MEKAQELLKSWNSSEGKIFHEVSLHLCLICRGAELLSNRE